MELLFKRLNDDAIIPKYAHDGDSGFDLYSDENIVIHPNEVVGVHTGLTMQLPKTMSFEQIGFPHPRLEMTFELQIRPKSGLALKGLTVFNTPGTIDNGYRGEIIVIMHSVSDTGIKISKGDKIAQGVVVPVICAPHITIREVESLTDTSRGTDGFGSTGYSSNDDNSTRYGKGPRV